MSTKQELLEKAEKIQRDLKSGKISGKATIKTAKQTMYSLRYRAKKAKAPKAELSKQETKAIAKVAKAIPKQVAKAAKKFNKDQGILPGFIGQINNARIEELVADKIFKALQRGLAARLLEDGDATEGAAVMRLKLA